MLISRLIDRFLKQKVVKKKDRSRTSSGAQHAAKELEMVVLERISLKLGNQM
jgi:hypothetical protein